MPIDAVPILGTFQRGHFIADSASVTSLQTPPMIQDPTISAHANMLRGTRFYVDPQEIINAIYNGNAIIGTDGSILDEQGTYAFTILIHTNQLEPMIALLSSRWMSSIAEHIDLDSHCPEAAALYAAHVFLVQFLQQ
jgi:hypothetical protein